MLSFFALLAAAPDRPIGMAVAPKTFLALRVHNAAASSRWYSSVFGLREIRRTNRPRFDQRMLDGARLMVELVQLKSGVTQRQASALGQYKGGLTVDDFDASLARWESIGVTMQGKPFCDAQLRLESALLKDPDGNLIQVFGRSRHATCP